MFSINDRVVIRPVVETFHYGETPQFSLGPVLTKLKRTKAHGLVKRIDNQRYAVGVLFPGMRDLVWFKTYEVQKG